MVNLLVVSSASNMQAGPDLHKSVKTYCFLICVKTYFLTRFKSKFKLKYLALEKSIVIHVLARQS